jgi:hypothetical protein
VNQGYSICGQWKILEHDLLGNLISEHESPNLVVNTGRDLTCYFLLGLGSASSIVALGVGASSTAVDATQTQLVYELIGNPTRKGLTNTSNTTLTTADFVLDTTVVSGTTYYKKIVLQSQYAAGDLNNGNTFNEYGLFTTNVNPLTPTASSGVMFNRFVDPAPIQKTASNSVTVQITLRF